MADDAVILEAPEPKGRKTPTVAEQFARNMAIVKERAEGDAWAVIAERHNLSVPRCKAIQAEYRAQNPTLEVADPQEIAKDLLEGFNSDVTTLNVGVRRCVEAENWNSLAGLVNARMKARENVAVLLQALGVMPHDLGTLRVELEANAFVDRVVRVLKKYSLPPEAWHELLEALGGPPADLDGDLPELPQLTSGS